MYYLSIRMVSMWDLHILSYVRDQNRRFVSIRRVISNFNDEKVDNSQVTNLVETRLRTVSKATVIRLNVSCTDEAAKARRNSAFRVIWPSETSLAVTVVPMLAPMTMKMALRTPMASAATMPIMILVVVDEL